MTNRFPSQLEIEEVGPTAWATTRDLMTPDFTKDPVSPSGSAMTLTPVFSRGGAHTLSFSLRADPPEGAELVMVRALADVSWTIEGHSIRRLFHVGSGASISGIGESVTCRITDDSIIAPTAAEPFPTAFKYSVTVGVAAGVRGPSPTPPIYAPSLAQNLRILAGDNESLIEIPSDAGINSVFIYRSGVKADDDLGKLTFKTYPFFGSWDGNSLGQWLPLLPGIRKIGVINSLTVDATISCIFGVDG